jgi:hypothetical protein
MGAVYPYYVEEWCRLFGYGSCRAMPPVDALVLWVGTAVGLFAILFLAVTWMVGRV